MVQPVLGSSSADLRPGLDSVDPGFPLASAAVVAQVVTSPTAGVEAARAVLERAYSLPPVGSPPPPSVMGARATAMLSNAARLGLAFIAGRYLKSDGELNLAKDLGQIGRSVTMDDMRQASAAMDRMDWGGNGMGQDWTADQRTRFVTGAAELERLRQGGGVGSETFSRSMESLYQTLAQQTRAPGPLLGPRVPAASTTPSPSNRTRSPSVAGESTSRARTAISASSCPTSAMPGACAPTACRTPSPRWRASISKDACRA